MIFIDNQEAPSDIMAVLDGMGVTYELCALKYGDFHITGENGLVVIERKTAADYLGSLVSGHLSDQLTRLSQEFKQSYVLVEGPIESAFVEGGVSRKAYFSSLVGTTIKRASEGEGGAISIIQVNNNWDTAMLLERIQHRMNDPDGLIRTPYIGAPQVVGGNNQVRGLCAIPGVGETTARGLLRFFGTIHRIARTTEKELLDVPNVGKITANTIVKYFQEVYGEDLDE